MPKLSSVGLVCVFCLVFFGLGAGACYLAIGLPTRGALAVAELELGEARRTLDEARSRSTELESRLGDHAAATIRIQERIDEALRSAGRIPESSKRIIYLVGAIRDVARELRELTSAGEPAPGN